MRYAGVVRTTLDIDDDLIQVAKELAQRRGRSTGQVVSELLRQVLAPKPAAQVRNGVPLFAPKLAAKKPSLALVNRLRDE